MIPVQQILDHAVRYHQAGNLQQAEPLYRQILQVDPHHVDALHLVGVVNYQWGRNDLALEYITKALQRKPDFAEALSNLGNVLKAQGKLEEAAKQFHQALRLKPDLADAHSNLGAVLLKQGKLDEAVASSRQALRLNPAHATAHSNLGTALLEQGKLDEAVASLRQALRLNPAHADAHINLGNALLKQGKLAEAVVSYRQALRLQPDYVLAHHNLGKALHQQGKREEAANCFQQALRRQPDCADAHVNLGIILHEQGRFDEAAASFHQALRVQPHEASAHFHLATTLVDQGKLEEAVACLHETLRLNPAQVSACNNLGSVFHKQGKLAEAVISYRQALRLEPDSFLSHYNLGQALKDCGKVHEAANCFQQALRLQPDFAEAHIGLGQMHEEWGELAEAEAAYRQSLRVQPSLSWAHARLAALLRGHLPEADLAALRERLADAQLTDPQRAQLLFALARVLDERADFDRAADCLRQAKAARRELAVRQNRAYVPENDRSFFEGVQREFGQEFFARTAGGGLDTQYPVFVFGLPRSGTTLVEQILASHSRVHGAGELSLARQSFEAIPALGVGSGEWGVGSAACPSESVRRLDGPVIRRLAQQHLDALTALATSHSPLPTPHSPLPTRIVDKTPGNYLYLGLLAAMFPRAVLIHCRRDLRDVAVSCWMNDFIGLHWANDPQHIASHVRHYRRLMDHWRAVLPVPIHEVHYEELTSDLEGVSRGLVAACRLDWEPACLEFYRTRRQVRTPSLTQVRQPIYQKSVGRWKNYETALADLFEGMRDEG